MLRSPPESPPSLGRLRAELAGIFLFNSNLRKKRCMYLSGGSLFCAVYVGQFIEFLIYNGYTWTRDYTTDDVYRQNSTIIEELTDERSGEKRIPKLQEQVSRGVEILPRTACYLMSGSLFSLRVVLNAESGTLRSKNTPGGYGSLAFSGEAR